MLKRTFILLLILYSYGFALNIQNDFKQTSIVPNFLIADLNASLPFVQTQTFNDTKQSYFNAGMFAVWNKLNIKNESNTTMRIYLYNARAGIDQIDIYLEYSNGTKESLLLGDEREKSNRQFINRHSAFFVTLEQNQNVEIYIRQANFHGVVDTIWHIQSSSEFAKSNFYDTLFYGLFIGLSLAIIIYNTSIFFAIKRPEYIYYSGIALSSLLSQIQVGGISYAIAPDIIVNIINETGNAIVMLGFLSMIGFNYYFLNVSTNFYKLKIYYKISVFIALFLTIMCFWRDWMFLYSPINIGICSLISIFLLYVGINAIKQKIAGALLYTIAQSILLLIYLYAYFIFRYTDTEISVALYALVPSGVLIDMVLLAIAMHIRFKIDQEKYMQKNRLVMFLSHINTAGGMINSIMHQWKTPLARLGALFAELEMLLETKQNAIDKLSKSIPLINNNLDELNKTAREFYSLYKQTNKASNFLIKDEIYKVAASLDILDSTINFQCTDNALIYQYKEAFYHIVYIILDNALAAAKKRDIHNFQISVNCNIQNGIVVLEIADNCGGIKQKNINSIFEMFNSDSTVHTKGAGLAIAKMLAEERLLGTISARNELDGAVFIVTFLQSQTQKTSQPQIKESP